MPTASGFSNQDSYVPDRLFAGDFHRETTKVTIASSVALTRGAVLGRVTADGKYLLSASGAVDGSEVPDAILADDADASGGDVEAIVYRSGEFNEDRVTLGTGHTVASIRQGLRERSIFLKKAVAA